MMDKLLSIRMCMNDAYVLDNIVLVLHVPVLVIRARIFRM